MAYLAGKESGCGLLLGAAGSGKSLVLSLFGQQQLKNGAAVATVSALASSAPEMLLMIGAGWQARVHVSDSLPELWQTTTDRLRQLTYDQVPALLLVDDLHQATADGAALVDRLQAKVEGDGVSLVVIAACDPQCSDFLSPRFLARAELQIELDPWTLEETTDYLQNWRARTGMVSQDYSSEGMEVLHNLSAGIPRHVRQLAELALLAGSGTNEQHLNAALIQSAYEELSISR